MLALVALGLTIAYTAWSFVCLENNVRKARALGFPVVRLPIDANNVFWILLQPHVWKFLDRLPYDWSSYPRFVRFSRRGWYVAERADAHVQLGPVWALVSPVSINVHVADPDTIQDIVTRRGDFQRPSAELKILELYGPCISTAKWPDWPRHRKPMATPFNETIMTSVWDESLRQARAMVQTWVGSSDAGIQSYQRDTRTLSLNVLAGAGFGKPYDFRSSTDPVTDKIGEYRDSLQTVLDNIILLLIVPFRVLTMIPGRWARIGNAGISFKQHMVKMLEDETTALGQGKAGSGGILTGFVRAADLYHRESVVDPNFEGAKKGLSPEEIYGNLFVINFAGHDTTANTLAFAMLLLAAHPEVQAWVAEEIAAVTRDNPVEGWDYKELFPLLNRCRAVVYETLRLFPPVPALPSITCDHTQEFQVSDKTYRVPVGINFTANLRAMQTHPQYWPNANEWQPSRWVLNAAPAEPLSPAQVAQETFFVPSKTVFFPWGEGPQICPGKRFAEVEAVAVIACLFKAHRLHIKKDPGESDESVHNRFEKCVNDIDLEMLVRLRDADQISLLCKEVL
ncbi:glutathione S- transferase, nitrogen catabolite repression regulator [Pestalotiopsis sp. IQ-011]